MFRFSRFYSVFRARNREFRRDIGALTWALTFPFIFIIAFGFVFNLEEPTFYKVGYFGPQPELQSELLEWIPYDNFQAAQDKLRYHRLDLVVDARQDLLEVWQNKESFKSLTAAKIFQAAFQSDFSPFVSREVTGERVEYIDWLFPGLIAMNMLWLSLWGVGWVIVQHRKTGVLKRFQASPVTPFEYLLAQMSSRLIILVLIGAIILGLTQLIRPVPMAGSYVDWFIIYLAGCLSHCAIGLMIAARINSEELAGGILNVITYPVVFLSEIWFSLEGSPEWVIHIAHAIPLWQMIDGMRQIMFEGASLSQLAWPMLIFSLVTVIGLAIGSLSFRWSAQR
jgi:ABC-type multidrug transport system permease subunit